MQLAGVLLRQVPAELVGRVASGELEVLGSIIRSVPTGRIVAHLQETSFLSQVLLKAPLSLGGIGDAIVIAQNQQIKAALGVVQSLQMANVALSTAAIGVSIAGTALLHRKLAAVEAKIDTLAPQLEHIAKGVEALRRDRIAEDLSRLTTLGSQLDECWMLANPESEWRDIARDAHFLAESFARRAGELDLEGESPLSAIPFLEALAIAASTRVTARVALNDMIAAAEAAEASAKSLARLGRRLQLGELVMSRMAADTTLAGTPAWHEALEKRESELAPAVSDQRQREISLASASATIAHLRALNIPGRDWLDAARSTNDVPVLCLPAED